MKFIKSIIALIIVLSCFLFSSCDELFDCIASTEPVLSNKQLRNGSQGFYYDDYINSEVKNDANDDDYDYFFDVEGQIPPGLSYNSNGRKLFFYGTPSATGTYTFKVRLTIEWPEYYYDNDGYFEDDNRICFGDDTTEKTYTLIIQ